jgi:hypothetical protein
MPDDATPNTPPAPQDWRDLAQKAATELDPKKLTNIVSELLEKLDEAERKRKALAQHTLSKSDGQP